MSIPLTERQAGNGARRKGDIMGAKKGPKMGVPRSIRKRDKKQIMLYKLRMEKGFSQRELADRAGVQRNTVMLIENGDTLPNLDTVKKLCDVLEVELGELFD